MSIRLVPVAILIFMTVLPASAQPMHSIPTFDIGEVIQRLAVEMDKEFIVDPLLAGAVGWSTTTGDDADYETLLGVLRANGFAAFEIGDQIRILPEEFARAEPSPVVERDDRRISDHAVVTRVLDVADLKLMPGSPEGTNPASQLIPVLRPLLSPHIGNLSAIPNTTRLVIVDRYDNVRRITAIIDELRP